MLTHPELCRPATTTVTRAATRPLRPRAPSPSARRPSPTSAPTSPTTASASTSLRRVSTSCQSGTRATARSTPSRAPRASSLAPFPPPSCLIEADLWSSVLSPPGWLRRTLPVSPPTCSAPSGRRRPRSRRLSSSRRSASRRSPRRSASSRSAKLAASSASPRTTSSRPRHSRRPCSRLAPRACSTCVSLCLRLFLCLRHTCDLGLTM